jgi:hypothetical protein
VSAVYVIGDVHGQLEKLRDLLRGAGLIDQDDAWSGADSALWFMGDLVDHGPDGVGVVALIMRLQEQASTAGGRVEVLLGNHDVLLLAAHRFGTQRTADGSTTFRELWEESGGVASDLERLTLEQARWLRTLPAMAREGPQLLIHADALFYTRYGGSLDEINASLRGLLHGDDAARWGRLLDEFGEHGAFVSPSDGASAAEAFLGRFGGERIVHGHTPVSKMTGQPAEAVREPLLYAGGRCLDVDPGMYLGGPGFVCRLPSRV